jgi:hypothetical protein
VLLLLLLLLLPLFFVYLGSLLFQAKAYTTRVGAGPYPTEFFGDLGEKVRNNMGLWDSVGVFDQALAGVYWGQEVKTNTHVQRQISIVHQAAG